MRCKQSTVNEHISKDFGKLDIGRYSIRYPFRCCVSNSVTQSDCRYRHVISRFQYSQYHCAFTVPLRRCGTRKQARKEARPLRLPPMLQLCQF